MSKNVGRRVANRKIDVAKNAIETAHVIQAIRAATAGFRGVIEA